jgi:hypothetical protein
MKDAFLLRFLFFFCQSCGSLRDPNNRDRVESSHWSETSNWVSKELIILVQLKEAGCW